MVEAHWGGRGRQISVNSMQPGLHSEFRDSQSQNRSRSLKTKFKKKETKPLYFLAVLRKQTEYLSVPDFFEKGIMTQVHISENLALKRC